MYQSVTTSMSKLTGFNNLGKKHQTSLLLCLLIFTFQYLHSETRTITVGGWSNYPVIFEDKNGEVKGFYVDLLNEIGEKENIRFKYNFASWDHCLKNIKSGKIDLLPGVGYMESRAQYADYSTQSIISVWGDVYAPKSSEINSILDITGKKIGIVKSDILSKNFKALVAKFNISCDFVEYRVYNEIFEAIANKKIDAGIAEVTYGWRKKDEYNLKSTGVVFNPTEYFFICPKGKNEEIILLLDEYLKKWNKQDHSFFDQTKEKWLHGIINTVTIIPNWLYQTLIALGIAIIITISFIILLKKRVEIATKVIKQGKSELRENNVYLNSILNAFNDAIFIHDASTGAIIDVNKSMCQMYGYTYDEAIHKSIFNLSHGETPYSNIEIEVWLNKAKTSQVPCFEWLAKHKDGHLFWVEISVQYVVLGAQHRFIVFAHNISNRKAKELELIKAKNKAEESDRLKTAFLQNMSHEIRTPMNAIMGFSDLLIDNVDNKSLLTKFTNIISNSCNDLLEIINDILSISKIESGQLTIHVEECDVIELFDDLYSSFAVYQKQLNKEHINFRFDFNGDNKLAIIQTDKTKLKQILTNLIGNAFKFTPKGSIKCDCTPENNHLIFSIEDTGIGIPEDKQDKIFERFFQVHHSALNNTRGTGLGLSIAKGLSELLGGQIWFESTVNKGTTFKFTVKNIILQKDQ
jgi:PAS domain S-box-containing protein